MYKDSYTPTLFAKIYYYTLHNSLLYKLNILRGRQPGEQTKDICNIEGNNRLSPGLQPLTTGSVLKMGNSHGKNKKVFWCLLQNNTFKL